ncbi:L,D-transpeptidase [Chelatococcus sp. GCM10030263]|uniref:L,D-transpeptidase n=1 Tax=Chelatococcus sp. GCM10030263 TaxID=3273387 RepID=UPI003606E21D
MGSGLLALGGCVTRPPQSLAPAWDPSYERIYGAIDTEPFPVPAVDLEQIDPQFLRREVDYSTPQPAGTIVVDPGQRFLYLVRPGGRAIRYGIGVGREGFGWNGTARVARKAQWPTWTPPSQMIKRQPELREYASGMPGGPDNPLGARALYLYQGDRDTLYRIHGTIEPWTIGHAVSSGCIRLIDQDVIDLYGRVPVGTKVVVLKA